MRTAKQWEQAASRLDEAHKYQLGSRVRHIVDPATGESQMVGVAADEPLSRWERYGRPGLFIPMGSDKQYPLEHMQRRYTGGDRTEELYASMMAVG